MRRTRRQQCDEEANLRSARLAACSMPQQTCNLGVAVLQGEYSTNIIGVTCRPSDTAHYAHSGVAARPPRALRRTPEYWHKIRGSGAEPRVQGADTFPVPCHSEASPRPTSSLASARAAQQDASIEPRHAYSRALRRPASQAKARPKPRRGHQSAEAECTRKPRRMDHLSGEGPAGAEHTRHADAHSPTLFGCLARSRSTWLWL